MPTRHRSGFLVNGGRTPRRIAALFLIFTLAASAVPWHVGAPGVQAKVFQILPADETETPVDSLTSNQALFAIGTTDPLGAEICIVEATAELDPGGGLSCDSGGAWGEVTNVTGLGTFIIPIEGPPLWPGTWKLLADGGEFPGADALSIPFTITACPGCSNEVAQAAVDAWKAQAAALKPAMDDTCEGLEFVGRLGQVKAAAGVVAGVAAIGFTAISIGGAGLSFAVIALDLPTTTQDWALNFAKHVSCRAGAMYRDIVADPPDPDYLSVEQPLFVTLPTTPDAAAGALVNSYDRMHAYGRAQLTAFERYQAAVADGSRAGIHLQADAMATFGGELVRAMRDSAAGSRAYGDALAADPDVNNPVLSTSSLQQILDIRTRVTNEGFTPDEVQQLEEAGLSPADIDLIRAEFAQDVSQAPVDVSSEQILDDSAAALEDAIPAFDLFAREAAVVAAVTNAPPVASFTADPTQSSSAPTNVHFVDTSTDPDLDPIVSRTWDFGDGGTAEGEDVSHIYIAVGTYMARLTVCDYLACSEATEQIFVGTTPPPNQPPIANADFLRTDMGVSDDVDVLANDIDPDGGDLAVTTSTQGVYGAVDCTSAGVCTYTPPVGFVGFDSFSYEISDGQGGTAVATVTVQVDPEPNVPPVAADDVITAFKNTTVQFNPLANDADPDGGTMFPSFADSPTHGSLDCSPTGVCAYTPDDDFVGSDGFDYMIFDNRGGSDAGHVSITVEDTTPPGNRSPVAVDDHVTMQSGFSAFIFPLSNDFDPDADALTISGWGEGAHGDVECFDFSFLCSYTPLPDYLGPDSFTYDVSDGAGGSDTGLVTVDVQNSLPVANPDVLVTGKGLPASVDVLTNDYDPNQHALAVIEATQGAHGSVDCTLAGLCTYTPEGGFVGTDEFQYTISDEHDGLAISYVSVTIREINDGGPDWFWREERELTFDPTITSPADFTCNWAFGDGTPDSSECAFAHTYADAGSFTATLTVEIDGGPIVSDEVHIQVLPVPTPGGEGGGIGGTGVVVAGSDVTYTLDADFERATFLNLNHDAPNSDELRLNGKLRPFPFVNIAASARGTIVRIDANTGEILGEYLTAPDGMGRNPSRTTVDQFGNVWVANRDEFSDSGGEPKGSVARVGLTVGGTRVDATGDPDPQGGYLAPPFAYNTCLDRDGDGLLRTSNGLSDILVWTNDGGADTEGGVLTAEDECIINYVRVAGSLTRTIAVDGNNDVWVGGLGDADHEKLDGDTGEPIPGTKVNFSCGGYGGLVDRNEILWSASLLRMDASTLQGECLPIGVYGLGLDPVTGNVWATAGARVYEIGPDGTLLNFYSHGSSGSQGVAVDDDGNVWVAHSGIDIGRVRTDGTFVGNVPLLGGVGTTGVAIDVSGKVWAANISSDDARRVDPEIGPVGGNGFATGWVDLVVDLGANAGPYNYSDMTGFVSIAGTSPQGFWRVVQDAGAVGADWQSISWNDEPQGQEPAGTSILVEARSSDGLADLAGEPFVTVGNGLDPGLLGRFIEVRVTLRTEDPSTSPALSDIQISAGSGPQNQPPAFGPIASQTIDEQVPFSLTLPASDPDLGQTLGFSLVTGPSGLAVSSTGNLTWTPTEAQGPGTYSVTVRVTDDGIPSLADEATFSITVREVNRAPVLDPIDDVTVHPGEQAAATATASDPDLPLNTLAFSLTSGPATATLDGPSGAFAWTPTLSDMGDHEVTIRVSDGLGGMHSGSFVIHVVRDATTLTLGGDTAGQYSDTATLTATLKVGSTPVIGATVSISLGAASTNATTNASGVASATFTIPGPAGNLSISASFAGTPSKAPSSASGTFAVNREDSTIVYSGDTIGLVGATLHLAATLTDSAALGFTGSNPETGADATIGDITTARISFAVYNAATCMTGPRVTTVSAFVTDTGTVGDGIGQATVSWSSSSEGSFCVVPSLVGAGGSGVNGFYVAPLAEAAGLAVFIDTVGKVTGGGWVTVGDGRANFGFNATSIKGPVKGNLVFIERTTYQGRKAILVVKSNAIDTLRTSGSVFPITATLTGKASFKFISSVDGSTLYESGNASFTATVVDTDLKGGTGDAFAIRVLDKTGAVRVDLGTTPLGAGNIVAHVK